MLLHHICRHCTTSDPASFMWPRECSRRWLMFLGPCAHVEELDEDSGSTDFELIQPLSLGPCGIELADIKSSFLSGTLTLK